MDTKLTLSLDKMVIETAKKYAKSQKISLSKLIEAYLYSLTTKNSEEGEISPFVKSLSGIIDLPKNFNYKDEYAEFLNSKYK